jgi:hypothetical protein
MSYRTGVAGLFEALSFVFIINIARIFLSGLGALIERGGQIVWLSVSLSGLSTVLVIYMLAYVFARFPGDLHAVCRRLLGGAGACLISLFYCFIFWANAVMLLIQYAENTVSTALPDMDFQVVVAFFAAFAAYACFLSLGGIVRAAGFFLWYLVVLFTLICVLLQPYYNVYELTPWQGHGVAMGLLLSLQAGSINFGVIALLVMAPSFQSLRTIRTAAVYGIGLEASLKVLHAISYIMVFGLAVGTEKKQPFFEMARMVYFGPNVQHIEALLILAWVVCGILSVAASLYVAMYSLARLLDLPALRPFLPLMMLLTINLGLLIPSAEIVMEVEAMFNKANFVGIYVIPALLFAVTMLKARNKACVRQ